MVGIISSLENISKREGSVGDMIQALSDRHKCIHETSVAFVLFLRMVSPKIFNILVIVCLSCMAAIDGGGL